MPATQKIKIFLNRKKSRAMKLILNAYVATGELREPRVTMCVTNMSNLYKDT